MEPFIILEALNHSQMKLSTLVIPCFLILISGCSPDIGAFFWLTGTWEMAKPNGNSRLESWEKESRKALTGKGISVANGDSTVLETIALYIDHHQTWYVPVVSDQNEGQAVQFKLVSASAGHFIFENPEHDFPQRITYHFKPLDKNPITVKTQGDSLSVDVTSLTGEGIQFQFLRK